MKTQSLQGSDLGPELRLFQHCRQTFLLCLLAERLRFSVGSLGTSLKAVEKASWKRRGRRKLTLGITIYLVCCRQQCMVGGHIRPNRITSPHTDPLLILLLKVQALLLGWSSLYTVLWLLAVVGTPVRHLVLLLSFESNSAGFLASFFDYSQYCVDSQTSRNALLTSVSWAKPSTHGPRPSEDSAESF